MILIKYILKETCKINLMVLVILLVVCLCQKFLKMLNLIIYENISIYLMFLCIGLNIPELGKLIIPFSVFLSVPITFYRLHMHNEILAMYACSVDKYIFIKSILFFTGIISVFAWINMSWLSPYCEHYQNKLLFEIRKNIDLMMLTEKKFQLLNNKYLVVFINNIQKKKLNNIFLVRKDKNALTIVVADQGNICNSSNELKLIILNSGICYEIYNKQKLYEDICVSEFLQYQIYLDRHVKKLRIKNKIHCMSMYQLWNADFYEARMELHWRLTLLMSIIIMPMIATLLFIKITSNYFLIVIFMMLLYVIFFFLHILLRFYTFVAIVNPIIWMWGVNIFYIMIIGILNIWNSCYIRKICWKIRY